MRSGGCTHRTRHPQLIRSNSISGVGVCGACTATIGLAPAPLSDKALRRPALAEAVSAPPSRSDFLHLRQAILFYLEALDKGARSADLYLLREAIARTEWKAMDRERRIWALGSAAGDHVAFGQAADLAQQEWSALEGELRRVLADRVLRWLPKETATA